MQETVYFSVRLVIQNPVLQGLQIYEETEVN